MGTRSHNLKHETHIWVPGESFFLDVLPELNTIDSKPFSASKKCTTVLKEIKFSRVKTEESALFHNCTLGTFNPLTDT